MDQSTPRATLSKRDTFSLVGFTFQDLLYILRKNWIFILLSVLLSVLLGALYVSILPKQYNRYTSLLIKRENPMSSIVDQLGKVSDMFGGSYKKDDVSNQMIILGTERIVGETIERLNLDVTYEHKEGLRMDNLYKTSPIRIRFIDGDPDEKITLSVAPSFEDESKVLLTLDWSSQRGKIEETITCPLSDTISTPIGGICIEPTPYFSQLKEYRRIYVSKHTYHSTVQRYMCDLSISRQQEDASVIKLSLNSTNPALAEDFLATLVATYRDLEREDKVRIAESTRRFVNERLAVISGELGEVDAEIESFKQSQQIADITAESQQYLTESAAMNARLVDLNNNISIAQFVRTHLKNKEHQYELIPANLGMPSASIETSISKYNDLILQRETLVANSSDSNPLVQEITNQLVALRLSIMKSIDNMLSALEVERQGILKEKATSRSRITIVPTQERIVGSIYRQQKIKEELYLFLLNLREQNSLAIESVDSDARLIQAPTGPLAPISPRKPLILLTAFLLGLIVPGAIIYLRFIINNKVRGKFDVERYTDIPIFGEIPHYSPARKVDRNRRDKKSLFGRAKKFTKMASEVDFGAERLFVIGDHQRNVVTEAFSVLRSNLSFISSTTNQIKRIMITSAIPASGKTFSSSNLALSLALAGHRTLIIDADLRKNTLSRGIGLYGSGIKGLSSYLSNSDIPSTDIIRPSGIHENLFIIPSGSTPPNPTELLLTGRLDTLFGELDNFFDYILIDAIPILNLADARIIGQLVDVSLLIVRENHLPRPLLLELDSIYQNKQLNGLCIVLNDAGISGSYGTYGYGSYGYGTYGHDPEI